MYMILKINFRHSIKQRTIDKSIDQWRAQMETRIMPKANIFLKRDAMRKRGLCCRVVSVCPSVGLSVFHVGALYPDG